MRGQRVWWMEVNDIEPNILTKDEKKISSSMRDTLSIKINYLN